jgi:tight adherence protein C
MLKFIFPIILPILLAANSYGKRKYSYMLEDTDIGKFHLRYFLPLGILLLKITNFNISGPNGQKVAGRISELFGRKKVQVYTTFFFAQKVCCPILVLTLLFFISLVGEVDAYFLAFSVIASAAVYFYADYELDGFIKARRRDILIELPNFLNKLALLVNAGLTVSGSIKKIVTDEARDTPLYRELRLLVSEMNTGRSEIQCYEEFSKRCRVQEVTLFISTLSRICEKETPN